MYDQGGNELLCNQSHLDWEDVVNRDAIQIVLSMPLRLSQGVVHHVIDAPNRSPVVLISS